MGRPEPQRHASRSFGGPRRAPARPRALVTSVGKTEYGLYFSPEVFAEDIVTPRAGLPDAHVGGPSAHLAPQLNVLAQYRAIERGEYATVATDLRALR